MGDTNMKQMCKFFTFLFLLTALVSAQNKHQVRNNLPEKLPITSEELIKFNIEKIQAELPEGSYLQFQYTLNSDYYVPDLFYIESWNGTAWENVQQIDWTYNDQGWLTEQLWQVWSSGWVNSNRTIYTYTGNGYVATETDQGWISGTWENNWRKSYTYNVNKNVTELLEETWIGSWEKQYRTLYEYFTNGNLRRETSQNWSGTVWDNSWRTSYEYSDTLVIEKLYQNWSGGLWVNDWKSIFSYNANGDLIQKDEYSWDGTNWVNFQRFLYIYDGKLLTQKIRQIWDNVSGWINNWKDTYTYNSEGKETEYLHQKWDVSQWVNDDRSLFTYDENGWMIEEISQNWNTGTGWENTAKTIIENDVNGNYITYTTQLWDGTQWVNFMRYHYTWLHIVSDVEDEGIVMEYSLENNYPNPFNPSTNIKFSLPAVSNVTLKVYDVLGKQVAEVINGIMESGRHEVQFSASGLSSGVYFYRLEAEGIDGGSRFVDVKKMTVLK